MTDLDLDRWLAEKCMEWEFVGDTILTYTVGTSGHEVTKTYNREPTYFDGDKIVANVADWHPTVPATGQIWLCVGRMRERGWTFLIECFADGEWNAVFAKDGLIKSGQDHSPCLAIAKAIKAALAEGK